MFAKNINYLRIVILAALLGLSLAVKSSLAQQPPAPQPEATPAKVEELEINVYGDRLLNKPIYSPFRKEGTLKDSTRPAYVINKNEIKAQGARTVREALQSLPGILGAGTVGTEVNALSGQYIRGSNDSQVLILLDGRPINNVGFGGFDLGEFSTSIVDRIEVLPGGGSTLYGSDAIGGIINIVTSRPTSDKLTFDTRAEVGNLGYTKLGVNMSKKDGNIGWLIGYDRIQANNNYGYSIPSANFSASSRPNNDAIYNNLRVRADVDASDRTKVNFTGIYLSKNQGVPGGVPTPSPQFGQGFFNYLTDANWKYNDQFLFDLGIDQKLGNGNDSTLTGRVYYDNLNTSFDSRTAFAETLSVQNGQVVKAVTPQTQSEYSNKQKSIGIQTQHNWQITPSQNITYGFDYRSTNNRATTTSIAARTKTVIYDGNVAQGALFGQYNVDLNPQVRATAGLRQDFSSLANGAATSPSLGVKWAVNPATTLRANYIRNFRTPDLTMSGYPTDNKNTEFLPGFTSFDANFLAPLISDRSLNLNASVQNIFNQRYELFAGFPDAGRTFRTGIDWKF
jgi:vitamin B12 transporter